MESTCRACGKPIQITNSRYIRQFCDRKCYGWYKIQKDLAEARKAPKQKCRRYMHPVGFELLVCAIVRQAREDILTLAPSNFIRQDAENFLLSDYFASLTNLDGFEILYRLSEQYDEKHNRKAGKSS